MAKQMTQLVLFRDELDELVTANKRMQARCADLAAHCVQLQADLDRAVAQWGAERDEYKAENARLRAEHEVEPSLEEIDASIPTVQEKVLIAGRATSPAAVGSTSRRR